jgi:hypothetical protein
MFPGKSQRTGLIHPLFILALAEKKGKSQMEITNPRQQKGLIIASKFQPYQNDGSWVVPSQSNGGKYCFSCSTNSLRSVATVMPPGM